MNKFRHSIILAGILIIFLLSSCADIHTVNTDSTKQLKNDVMAISQSVTSVDVTVASPGVNIRVKMKEKPSETIALSILDEIKEFSTLENIDPISSQNGMKDHALYVNLMIVPEKDGKYYYSYTARFYDSANRYDNSIPYAVWEQETLDPDR